MRNFFPYKIDDVSSFREKLLYYVNAFERSAILTSNEWAGSRNEMIAAIGSLDEIPAGYEDNSFEALKTFYDKKKDWVFGFLSYDLKNQVEKLTSSNFDGIGAPAFHFFQPEYVLVIRNNEVKIGMHGGSETQAAGLFREIHDAVPDKEKTIPKPVLQQRIDKKEYVAVINKIRQHIAKGDIYEMNYCMEFFSENCKADPAGIFLSLNRTSQAPFSAFYRLNGKYLMCSSPERFLKKSGSHVISQPIKGTAPRGETPKEDLHWKEKLLNSIKDKSENVMIVDLVRNDLSKTCRNVKVEELFGIYTFKQWHQMISTVGGEVREGIHITDIIKNAFPMGSMTGAPKLSAMKLIEQYEKTKRGMYSGAVGYITPEGDFDFNVVIRTILYNDSSKYLSFQVGSAITASSIAEDEYEECLVKAKGMFHALHSAPVKSNSYA